MNVHDFLTLVKNGGRSNYMVVCPDNLGVTDPLVIWAALAPGTAKGDVYFHNAQHINVTRAREIAREAYLKARCGSELNVYVVSSLQKLAENSVAPLMNAVEGAESSRFIFQTQSTPKKIYTLMSRSRVIRLAFTSRSAVLASMPDHDAKIVAEFDLYDGTVSGALRDLPLKGTLTDVKAQLSKGLKGLPALFNQKVMSSGALEVALNDMLTPEEREFVRRHPEPYGKQLLVYLVCARNEKTKS
jgi:hypothetical protein